MKMKKFLALTLALLMLLSMSACGGNTNVTQSQGGETKDGPSGTLNIVAADFGYGINWLKALAQLYMAQNSNATIKVEGTVIPHQLLSQIEGGLSKYDLFFGTTGLHTQGAEGIFVNLNDVYAATPEGEDKTVEEKVGTLAASFQYKGNYYSVPYVLSPEGLVVNDTTMKSIYGDNYTLPNTTDEMLALFDELKTKDVYPYIDSIGYTGGMIETWWAQYDSEGYENYFLGQYVDENGETQKAMNGESLTQEGKKIAMELASLLMDPANGYNHAYASSMDFAEAQLVFCGHGYGSIDTKQVAFMSNGAWLENEMEATLSEYPIEFRMFRVPVLSAIIEKCPDGSIADDAELSALITAIDAGSTSLSGEGYEVTQNDFDKIYEARFKVAHVSSAHQAGIVSTCQSVDLAKDFLLFMASNQASSVVMNELGGLTLSYGFMPTAEKLSNYSSFIQSVYAVADGATYLNSHGTDGISGLHMTYNPNGYWGILISGEKTGLQIYNEDIAQYTSEWAYLLAATN